MFLCIACNSCLFVSVLSLKPIHRLAGSHEEAGQDSAKQKHKIQALISHTFEKVEIIIPGTDGWWLNDRSLNGM
jgi:hypothetical protein